MKVEFISHIYNKLSSRYTVYSYNQYSLNINFFEVYLRSISRLSTNLLGKMRGYHMIGNNLQDFRQKYPEHASVFKNIKDSKAVFIILTCFQSWSDGGEWDSWQHSRIAFKLNNWE